ncbi:hypothetical protein ACIOJE_35090 [Kitasatospora sp. NPDC087861]|uniref:hypothetical protein n=1 Tax=Kitasatospora sp. NPDC087861 TaxID=3364070 RepID=UPI0038085D1C
MATLTAAGTLFLPRQRVALPEETPVNPAHRPADDLRLDQAVRLLAEHPEADTADLAHAAHQQHGSPESTWRRLITQTRAELTDRTGLIEATGLSRRTLNRLWAERADNGHPVPVTVDGVMHWHPRHWQTWHTGLTEERATQHQADAGGITRDGEPDDLVPWRELGRILGHKDGTTVAGWRKDPPAGPIGDFLRDEEPDGEILYRGQLQPAYRRQRLWDIAAQAPRRGQSGANRGAGRRTGTPHIHAHRDTARRLIAEHPDWTTADLIRAAIQQVPDGPGKTMWRRIIETARTDSGTDAP